MSITSNEMQKEIHECEDRRLMDAVDAALDRYPGCACCHHKKAGLMDTYRKSLEQCLLETFALDEDGVLINDLHNATIKQDLLNRIYEALAKLDTGDAKFAGRALHWAVADLGTTKYIKSQKK